MKTGNTQKPALAPKSEPKVRCLVIQLARLGDTLQSLMALRAAQQLYPQLEIHFLARDRFAAAAQRVPWIASVTTLPSDQLLAPVIAGSVSEAQALRELARWVRPLAGSTWDLVVNWSYSEASSFLTGLLPARIKLGYSRNRDTSFASLDGWSHYIQAVVQDRIQQNIHLTDILTTQLLTALQIHVGDPQDAGESAVSSRSFFRLSLPENELERRWRLRRGEFGQSQVPLKWVAVQLGAGQESKTYPATSWARVLELLLSRHPQYGAVLVGGPEDRARAQALLEALPANLHSQVLDLAGDSDFDLWAGTLARSQWVLSADTAALHLASVLGTRVLNVSVGPVDAKVTGPYGNGHFVIAPAAACEGCTEASLEPARHSCRTQLSPEAVYAVWAYGSSEWDHRRQLEMRAHFERLGWSKELEHARVYRSRIRDAAEGGGVVYESQVARPLSLESWAGMVVGHVARAWYCGWVPTLGQELQRETISPELVKKLREIDESSVVLAKISEEARRTAATLNQRSHKLRSDRVMDIGDREELRELGKKLIELDALIERLGRTIPSLLPFANMTKVLMHNLRGENLTELGRESADCYRQINEGVTLLRDWVKHTLKLARPVAVAAALAAVAPAADARAPGAKPEATS